MKYQVTFAGAAAVIQAYGIAGSALIDAISRPGDPVQNAAQFVFELRRGLQKIK